MDNTPKTRLLFYVNIFLAGGIEKVLVELLRALDKERYSIVLLIGHHMGEHEVLKKTLPPEVQVEYVLTSSLLTWARRRRTTSKLHPLGKFADETFLTFFKRQAHRKRLRELSQQADVVIDYDMTLSPYISAAKAPRTAAYCHFSFAHYWGGRRSKLEKLAGRLARYNTVVMLCEEMMQDAVREYPVLKGKAVRIYNALDKDSILRRSKEDAGDIPGLGKEPYFVSAGRLQESQKDFSTLIRAYALAVKNGGIKEKLVIVGQGGSLADLQALAASEGVGDKVIFTGFRPNPYPVMAGASLFLFSSKYEGLPTVLIEAQMLGLPVISTQTPTGAAELLLDGRAGMLTPVGDAHALANAIAVLTKDEARKAAFRSEAAVVMDAFRPDYMVAEFERLVVGSALPRTA